MRAASCRRWIVAAALLLCSTAPSHAGGPTDGFTLPVFPIGAPNVNAYNAAMVSALDHAGTFYTQCCDTVITAYTGETVTRGDGGEFGCPAPPVFPECFIAANCICSYADGEGDPFIVNGNYTGAFGSHILLYDGHAGYDYGYGFDTPLVATRGGQLCKAFDDPINGTSGQPNAWDGFHTFFIDHGTFGQTGYASWYLHATDLDGVDMSGQPLANLGVGGCAQVEDGQLVGRVGNFGTFAPHLHFEVRIYTPAFGPEVFPQVIDPYGWTGAGPDPWSQGGNNQAASRLHTVWVPEPSASALALAALIAIGAISSSSRRDFRRRSARSRRAS
jgi:hypothetical protein